MIYPSRRSVDLFRREGLFADLYSLVELQIDEKFPYVWPYCHNMMRCAVGATPAMKHSIGRRKSNCVVHRCPDCGAGLQWKETLRIKDRKRLVIKKCDHSWVKTEPKNPDNAIVYCFDCKVPEKKWLLGWNHYEPLKDSQLEFV